MKKLPRWAKKVRYILMTHFMIVFVPIIIVYTLIFNTKKIFKVLYMFIRYAVEAIRDGLMATGNTTSMRVSYTGGQMFERLLIKKEYWGNNLMLLNGCCTFHTCLTTSYRHKKTNKIGDMVHKFTDYIYSL